MIDYQEAAAHFKALAHPVRLQILDMLRDGEVCVCHMEAALGKRQAYISQQLMVLRDVGLVDSRRDGLQVFYRIINPDVEALLDASLGPTRKQAAALDDCPCPKCTTAVTNIDTHFARS